MKVDEMKGLVRLVSVFGVCLISSSALSQTYKEQVLSKRHLLVAQSRYALEYALPKCKFSKTEKDRIEETLNSFRGYFYEQSNWVVADDATVADEYRKLKRLHSKVDCQELEDFETNSNQTLFSLRQYDSAVEMKRVAAIRNPYDLVKDIIGYKVSDVAEVNRHLSKEQYEFYKKNFKSISDASRLLGYNFAKVCEENSTYYNTLKISDETTNFFEQRAGYSLGMSRPEMDSKEKNIVVKPTCEQTNRLIAILTNTKNYIQLYEKNDPQ